MKQLEWYGKLVADQKGWKVRVEGNERIICINGSVRQVRGMSGDMRNEWRGILEL